MIIFIRYLLPQQPFLTMDLFHHFLSGIYHSKNLNVKFMKYGPKTAGASTREWFEWTGPLVLSNNRQTVSYTVADGGVGDSNPAPGRIADPIAPVIFAAGPGGPVTSIPVNAPWALALLSALMGGLAWRRQRAVQG